MSEATVDVPAVGRVKKQYVLIGAALVAGIVGYAWWRNSSAPPEDIPAYDESDVTSDGIADTAGGAAGGSANSGGASHDDNTVPSTDAEWTRTAVELLGGGYDVGAIQTALGRYITHQTLDSGQEAIVRAAIGQLGYPPGGAYPVLTGGGATPSALTEPKGLKQVGSGPTTVKLQWSPVAGASGYRLYRSDVDSNIGTSKDTEIELGGLDPATSYKIHVRAVDAAQKLGPRSADLTVKTAGAKLKAPTGLTVTAVTSTTVSLKWSPVAGAEDYRVYRKGAAQNIGTSRDTTIKVPNLRPNTTYTFYVAAVAGNTTGPKSSGKSAKTRK